MTTQISFMQKLPGLFFVIALAFASSLIVKIHMMANSGLSPLVIAIILGILIGNSFNLPTNFTPGIQFAAKRILRLAIILYGFRVTFQEIASVGVEALMIDIIVVTSTLAFGFLIGRKIFKLDRDLSLLISIGAAICGAAAVLAAEDILRSDPYKATIAIGTVVLFGTLAMFLYPALQHAGFLGFNEYQFGIFTGASIHEVAQALVAGSNISSDAGKIAVIVKMIRVLLLVPVLFLLTLLFNGGQEKNNRVAVPWFAIGFVLVIGFNSLHWLTEKMVRDITQVDILLLTMAMGAIGLETKMSKLKKVGMNPLYLSIVLFAWLITSVGFMVRIS